MKNRKLDFLPELETIIRKCDACTLSMTDLDGKPYAVPMNFGYQDGVLYLHSAPDGKKIEILKQQPAVCASFSTDHDLRWQHSEVACSYSMRYRSVLLFGNVSFIEDVEQKQLALDVIMRQYTDQTYKYSLPALQNVCVMRVAVDSIEGRAYGY